MSHACLSKPMKSAPSAVRQVPQSFCRLGYVCVAARNGTVDVIIINVEEDDMKLQVTTGTFLFQVRKQQISRLVRNSAYENVDAFNLCNFTQKSIQLQYHLIITCFLSCRSMGILEQWSYGKKSFWDPCPCWCHPPSWTGRFFIRHCFQYNIFINAQSASLHSFFVFCARFESVCQL